MDAYAEINAGYESCLAAMREPLPTQAEHSYFMKLERKEGVVSGGPKPAMGRSVNEQRENSAAWR